MKKREVISAAALACCAGMAAAAPATVDGVKGAGEPYVLLWAQNQPTAFGDNSAGKFTGGDFGDPPGDVATGVEIRIALSVLNLVGVESIDIGGWVNSGDRTYKSNQIIGALPVDTGNIGGAGTDFTAAPFDTTTQHVTVNLGSVPSFTPTIDGTKDASYGTAAFLQGNYTGFGNDTDGTVDGDGPNGGGSEIDALYVAKDGTYLYLFVAGNLEFNGNGLDIYIDTPAAGVQTLGTSSGNGAFIVNGQTGTKFDAGMDADYVISVDSWDDDSDGLTPNVPRAWAGSISGGIDNCGWLAGYGAANAGDCTGGDSGAAAVRLGVDNSNIAGVIGSPATPSPVSPDADWGYGSEIDNVWAYFDDENSDTVPDKLYILVGGNAEANYNTINFFLDTQSGGQNALRGDNIDISYNGLNRMGESDPIAMSGDGVHFDAGFAPDYWMNVNCGVDGGTGNLQNYTDCAVLRTDGPLFDAFSGFILDYGAYFGGFVTDGAGNPVAMPVEVMDFSGPTADIQDGTKSSLYANYAPRTLQLDPMNPVAGLLQTAIDNSNVEGVTDASADDSCAVMTGMEICIDLDEAGWDGSQDILMTGWVSNGGFDYVSNQVIGGLPAADNLAEVRDVDFTTITGDQFINVTALYNSGGISCTPACPCDIDGNGTLNLDDVNLFAAGFIGGDLGVDQDGNGILNLDDVNLFASCFISGCP
ncbi:MAG: hypothetical protein R3B49_06655 [Phycisphaerales bacterium]